MEQRTCPIKNKKMTKKILIGKIISVFGIKGEVKIISYCGEPQQIENYSLFDEKENPLKLKISNKNKAVIGTSNGNAILIAKLDGINNRNAAEKLRGTEIFTNRDDFKEADENEFYYVDLIGLDVIDMKSKKNWEGVERVRSRRRRNYRNRIQLRKSTKKLRKNREFFF